MAELPRFTLSMKKNKQIAKQRREILAAATKAQESTDTNALNEANVELPTTSSPISAAEEVKAYATTALLSATSDNVASFESSPVPSTQVAVAQSILTEEIPVHPVQNTLDNTTTSQEGLAEVKTRIQDHDVETKREKIMKLLDMVPGLEFLDKEFKLTYTNIIDLMNDAFGPSGWSHKIIKCEEQHSKETTDNQHEVCYTVITALTLHQIGTQEGLGVGYGRSQVEGEARVLAITAAKSNAFLQTSRLFGSLTGNAIFDKDVINELKKEPRPPKKKLKKSMIYHGKD